MEGVEEQINVCMKKTKLWVKAGEEQIKEIIATLETVADRVESLAGSAGQ